MVPIIHISWGTPWGTQTLVIGEEEIEDVWHGKEVLYKQIRSATKSCIDFCSLPTISKIAFTNLNDL